MRRTWLILALFLAALTTRAPAASVPPDCAAQAPWGAPVWQKAEPALTLLCRDAYVALHDTARLVPDFVSWALDAPHALGCLPRVNPFAPDPDLPAGHRAELADYKGATGYDRGHFAPNADFAWDKTPQKQSFYLSNMSPQASHLNQWQWASLEDATRTWAVTRGSLIVMDGPIWNADPGTIGIDKVAIPQAYWKVIVDTGANAALAFIMQNHPIPKGDLTPFQVSVGAVETAAGLSIPLPAGIDKRSVAPLWPIDGGKYREAKKKACS